MNWNDYILVQNEKGRQVPQKVGMKGITRDGIDYEFTTVLDIDIHHHATASKDRTGLFMDKQSFVIDSETGKSILEWCLQGVDEFKRIAEEKEAAIKEVEIMGLEEIVNTKVKYKHLLKDGSPLNKAISSRYKDLMKESKATAQTDIE